MKVTLSDYDWIVVNSSAGKDSQCMLDVIFEQAKREGVLDRVLVVHCDLGRLEWHSTKELAAVQAAHYGLRFEVVKREQGDILQNVMQKHRSVVKRDKRSAKTGKLQVAWPDPQNRWCTSEHKTAQVFKLITQLVDESSMALWGRKFSRGSDMPRPIRVLSCLGIRADESDKRTAAVKELMSKYGVALQRDVGKGSAKRIVDQWYPIAHWTLRQVWDRIDKSGVPYHQAYDLKKPGDRLGMSRLSCCFCMMASIRDLVIAARREPELALEYVIIEQATHTTWAMDKSMAQVVELAASPKGQEIIDAPDDERCSFSCM